VRRFAFTGGDPFVYIREILEIMRAARRAGVVQPFHMVTSGYWAKDDIKAQSLLADLAEAGMDLLYVSYDYEHARWVSKEQVHRIALCCQAVGIHLHVYGVFWNTEERVEDLLPDLEGVPMTSEFVTPIGAARPLFNGRPRYKDVPEANKSSCGRCSDYDITIYPNGDVFPCCSGGFNKEAKLHCGNAFQEPAAAIMTKVFGQRHARLAKSIGFLRLRELVAEVDPQLLARMPKFSDVDSVCEMCRDLHKDEVLQKALAPYYDTLEIEYAIKKADAEWDLLDLDEKAKDLQLA
jgi:MoaA/NifB/PqqE/SkfB family radical SAM enzyme